MARLFTSSAVLDAMNARNRQAWRDQRGLGESVLDFDGTATPSTPVVSLVDSPRVRKVRRLQDRLLESDIQREIKLALAIHPAVETVFRFNSGAHVIHDANGTRRYVRYHNVPGMSDLVCSLKHRYGTRLAFIEVKRPGEKPTDNQAAFLEAVAAKGHVAFVAYSAADAFERLTLELSR